jgi:hypothetical protein
MSYSGDKNLSLDAQRRIQEITDLAKAGKITWGSANAAANNVRSGEGGSTYQYKPSSSGGGSSGMTAGNYAGGKAVYTPGGTDYAAQLTQLMNGGNQDADYLQGLVDRRVQKANSTPGLEKYANDEIYQRALSYIQNLKQNKQPEMPATVLPQMQSIANGLINTNLADFENSDQYAQLKSQYEKNGQMGMQDLLGQIGSRTGGLASSYAATAADQTYNDWMAKLQQAAQEMYQQNRSDQVQNLNALQGIYADQYGQYQDQLGQFNTNRSYNYGVQSDNRNFNYQTGRDAVSDQRYNQEYADSRKDTEWQQREQDAAQKAQYGDFSGYASLGYSAATIAKMQRQYQLAQVAGTTSSSGSSGNSRSSGGSSRRSSGRSSRRSSGSYSSGSRSSGSGGVTSAALGSSSWCAAVYNNMQSGGYRTATDYLNAHYKQLGLTSGKVGYYAKVVADWAKKSKGSGSTSAEMDARRFETASRTIQSLLKSKQYKQAETNINSIWDSLNAQQRSFLRGVAKKYNIKIQ